MDEKGEGAMSGSDLIRLCKPNPGQRAYVLGGLAHRVSIHTQQLRAVRLVAELLNTGEIGGTDRAIVVGGGFAGITCAAALAAKGIEVTIFERSKELVPIQVRNRTRVLSPTSVSWPDIELNDTTDLPFLNWYSGYSQDVANSVLEDFRRLFINEENAKVSIRLKSQVRRIDVKAHPDDHFEVCFSEVGQDVSSIVHSDLIFLATGFPFERKISGFDRFSYWEDRNALPLNYSGECPRVAIIGDGDGALTDLFRCFWTNRQLERISRAVGQYFLADADLRTKLRTLEETFSTSRNTKFESDYEYFYRTLLSKKGANHFFDSIEQSSCEVVMFSGKKIPFSVNASPLNKAILGYLYLNDAFKFHNGIVDQVLYDSHDASKALKASGTSQRELGGFRVRVNGKIFGKRELRALNIKDTSKNFDRVVERIGPKREFCKITLSLFDATQLEHFKSLNSITLRIANPIKGAEWKYDDRLGLEAAKYDKATRAIRQFLSDKMDIILPDTSIRVTSDLKIEIDCEDEFAEPDRKAPAKWFGIDVLYNNIADDSDDEVGQVRASLPRHSFLNNLSPKEEFGSVDVLALGQTIALGEVVDVYRDNNRGIIPLFGRIAGFVTARVPNNVRDVYIIFPRHICGTFSDTRVRAVILDGTTGRSVVSDREIAIIDRHYAERMRREAAGDKYSVFNDFQVARVLEDVSFTNSILDKRVVDVKSPFYHVKSGNKALFVDGREVGPIASIFNHKRLDIFVYGSLFTETFSIRCGSDVNVAEIASGSMVHTSRFKGVGFVIGSKVSTNELFCVEYKKVFDRLGLEFVDA
ncbi:FAD-dependent oxidoreductase [Jiella avicenniae]|uniref:NAD-binding protein n=1 Tax=Jiella avicenniae TaxID=2907202 RepID=A0A9X1P639_9HYPH|nr:FAD-dependent oxidoreductase [Jiella avicenniae]MCE7030514.1 NAD-binding protein [Jiella avicenniae]